VVYLVFTTSHYVLSNHAKGFVQFGRSLFRYRHFRIWTYPHL